MDSYVKASFWSDDRIENLEPSEKLACLWLITNTGRDLLGFSQVTARRFCFETGLSDLSPLQGACKGLPTSFRLVSRNVYFAVNFLRHQFGKGGKISLKNNVVRAVIRHAKTLPIDMQRAFLDAYPELAEFVLEDAKNIPENEPPSNPLPRGREEKSSVEKSSVENIGEGCGEKQLDDHFDLANIVGAYPRREGVAEALGHVRRSVAAGTAPEAIMGGTRAIAGVIREMPSGHLNKFVVSAANFFRHERWRDDPQTWLRSGASRNGAAAASLDLGGRKIGSMTKL